MSLVKRRCAARAAACRTVAGEANDFEGDAKSLDAVREELSAQATLHIVLGQQALILAAALANHGQTAAGRAAATLELAKRAADPCHFRWVATRRSRMLGGVHHQHWHRDLLQIPSEISLREADDAVVVGPGATHHALAPPVLDDRFRGLHTWAVESLEGPRRQVAIKLRAVGRQLGLQVIEHFLGRLRIDVCLSAEGVLSWRRPPETRERPTRYVEGLVEFVGFGVVEVVRPAVLELVEGQRDRLALV
jgi:hypothetical protein